MLFPAASPGMEIKHCGGLKTGLLKAVKKKKKNLTQRDKSAPAFTRIHIFHISKPYDAIVCFLHSSHKISQSILFLPRLYNERKAILTSCV